MKNKHIDYHKHQRRKFLMIIGFMFLVLISVYISLKTGVAKMDLKTIIKILFGKHNDESLNVVVWNIRLPRIIASIFAGAALGISGCIMQNNLKNPLASPSTIGVTSAAAFGANFGIIVLGAGSFHSSAGDAVNIVSPYIVTLCAFVSTLMGLLQNTH